jgi:7-carboxy-7-deazaguanine synthase
VSQDWFADLDWLILSPKPPSSGMTTDWKALEHCVKATDGKPPCVLKIVVFNDADYSYVQAVAARYPTLPIYLQVGNRTRPIAASKAVTDEPNL